MPRHLPLFEMPRHLNLPPEMPLRAAINGERCHGICRCLSGLPAVHHIVLVSESTKQAVLLELTVPWEDRLEEAFERKLSKYAGLVSDCHQAGWKQGVSLWRLDAEDLQPGPWPEPSVP
ncbi:hypothetical protein N1851_028301 [Merluccius polli]|uniref:Uncharacterized protein n=1 Tax=Merluccius polli TaxID=89951 RepID=A0AA47M904_MERPO|nr:hypothetical protein N1851_028301 [Merluccius polli]